MTAIIHFMNALLAATYCIYYIEMGAEPTWLDIDAGQMISIAWPPEYMPQRSLIIDTTTRAMDLWSLPQRLYIGDYHHTAYVRYAGTVGSCEVLASDLYATQRAALKKKIHEELYGPTRIQYILVCHSGPTFKFLDVMENKFVTHDQIIYRQHLKTGHIYNAICTFGCERLDEYVPNNPHCREVNKYFRGWLLPIVLIAIALIAVALIFERYKWHVIQIARMSLLNGRNAQNQDFEMNRFP